MSGEQDDGLRASVGGPSPEAIRRRAEDLIERGTARLGFVAGPSGWLRRSTVYRRFDRTSSWKLSDSYAPEGEAPAVRSVAVRKRPRTIPDVPRAYREAIRSLVREKVKLTWQKTAIAMRDRAKLDTLDPKTLARPELAWAGEHRPDERVANGAARPLSWALDGLERLGRQGRFTEPASSKDAMLTLADLVSPASAFVRDRCETGPGEEVLCATLYAAWKSWAEDNGHRTGSVQTFGRNLRAVLPGLRTVRPRDADGDERQRPFQGVSLKTRTYNCSDRGPSRLSGDNEAPVRTGPRPNPLSAVVWDPERATDDDAESLE